MKEGHMDTQAGNLESGGGTATWSLNVFITGEGGGSLREEVSVDEKSQPVNFRMKEAVVASICTHGSVIHKH